VAKDGPLGTGEPSRKQRKPTFKNKRRRKVYKKKKQISPAPKAKKVGELSRGKRCLDSKTSSLGIGTFLRFLWRGGGLSSNLEGDAPGGNAKKKG